MEKSIDPMVSFRLLLQACFGVLIGVFFALLLARLTLPLGGRPVQMPEEMLPWNLSNVLFKPREKGFYLLTLLLGSIGAYLTTARIWSVRLLPLCIVLIGSMPLINSLARHLLKKNDTLLVLICATVIFALFTVFANYKARTIQSVGATSTNYRFRWWPYLFFLSFITILLLPASINRIAATIGMEMHVVSFVIGPALYSLGKHLVPGLDYFTQYSVGMGWLFSYLLGLSIQNTMINYVYLVIFAMWLFYAQLLYLLHWLYQSWIGAALISLLSLILLFHTSRHFYDPSSTVMRYPLLGICAWLLARWISQPRSVLNHLALAIGIAFCIFLNTETGIIIALAITFASLLSAQRLYPIILRLVSLGLISFLMFIALLLTLFGKRVLQWDFVYYLIEPLLIYGKIGFGGWPISWSMKDFNWLYNLLSPTISLATLALIARTATNEQADRPRLAVLGYFALSGLLMLAKYTNMSIVALWQMNAIGLLVVMGWWACEFVKRCGNKKISIAFIGAAIPGSFIAWGILIALVTSFASYCNDVRNPSEYALQSWKLYPSFIKSVFHRPKGCGDFNCVPHVPAEKDIELIKQRTSPGEPVAIIDLYDWAYLASAHRPPVMFFLPSVTIFTKHQFNVSLDRLKKARYLFLPSGANNEPEIGGALGEALQPTFHKLYVFDGVGERLTAWRRKDIISHERN